MMDPDLRFLREAISLSAQAARGSARGPFGAVVVRGGEVMGRGWNEVVAIPDPTGHAEIMAIRDAARRLGTHDLSGCAIYSSCEPCPMCLAAIHWARLDRLVFAAGREDAAWAGFDDVRFRDALLRDPKGTGLIPGTQALREEAREALAAWLRNPERISY
jgi:guanine deaminase